jgi:hypothetical protein
MPQTAPKPSPATCNKRPDSAAASFNEVDPTRVLRLEGVSKSQSPFSFYVDVGARRCVRRLRHHADRRRRNHRFVGLGQALVVTGDASPARQLGEGPLDPATGPDREAALIPTARRNQAGASARRAISATRTRKACEKSVGFGRPRLGFHAHAANGSFPSILSTRAD